MPQHVCKTRHKLHILLQHRRIGCRASGPARQLQRLLKQRGGAFKRQPDVSLKTAHPFAVRQSGSIGYEKRVRSEAEPMLQQRMALGEIIKLLHKLVERLIAALAAVAVSQPQKSAIVDRPAPSYFCSNS